MAENHKRRDAQAAAYEQFIKPQDEVFQGLHANNPLTKHQEAVRYRNLTQRPLGRGVDALGRLRDLFGYGEAEDTLSRGARAEYEAGAPVNLRAGDSTTLPQLSAYARERLGSGLTPEEVAALRGPQIESVEAAASEAKRQAANSAVASGYGDPRLGQMLAGRIENQREQGRAGVERDLVTRELQRKGEIENLSGRVAQQEEAGRQFNITAEQERKARLEATLGALGAQGEARREYDTGFVQARNDAKMSRQMLLKALRRAEPSGLERASSIIGGVAGAI